MRRFIIGVDEAGRGPLAGPVAVGLVMVPATFKIKKHFPDAADSKILSEKKREEIYERLVKISTAGEIKFCVRFSTHLYIDKFGITKAVRRGIYSGVNFLAPKPAGVKILLDGLLYAPPQFEQETIIRGDATEPIISLASIAAKVERDRLMLRLAKKYPQYGFENHKGYATRGHYRAIKKYGLCDIHRKSWNIGRLTWTCRQRYNAYPDIRS